MSFWKWAVQKILCTMQTTEEHGAGLDSNINFLDIICKDLCNGFGLRNSEGECYAYGSYV